MRARAEAEAADRSREVVSSVAGWRTTLRPASVSMIAIAVGRCPACLASRDSKPIATTFARVPLHSPAMGARLRVTSLNAITNSNVWKTLFLLPYVQKVDRVGYLEWQVPCVAVQA